MGNEAEEVVYIATAMPVKPTVMIVDDMKSNRMALKALLRKVDANIIEAGSGNEALAKALETSDLAMILLDVQMPEMDGYEVLRLLRQEEDTRHIPTIFLTAVHRDNAHALKGYDSGAVDYMHKPPNPVVLVSKVKIFIELWQLRHKLETEIQQRKEAEKEIKYLATHDALTGLKNRRELMDDLNYAIKRTRRYGGGVAVLFMDLDGFKQINDRLGHDVGDQVLVDVAKKFESLIRDTDTIARYGGDEFVILLTDIENRKDLEHKLEQLVASACRVVGEEALQLSVSIGVTECPGNSCQAEELIRFADEAMYRSKQSGRNQYCYYQDGSGLHMGKELLSGNWDEYRVSA